MSFSMFNARHMGFDHGGDVITPIYEFEYYTYFMHRSSYDPMFNENWKWKEEYDKQDDTIKERLEKFRVMYDRYKAVNEELMFRYNVYINALKLVAKHKKRKKLLKKLNKLYSKINWVEQLDDPNMTERFVFAIHGCIWENEKILSRLKDHAKKYVPKLLAGGSMSSSPMASNCEITGVCTHVSREKDSPFGRLTYTCVNDESVLLPTVAHKKRKEEGMKAFGEAMSEVIDSI